jgi:ATP-binding cassette subfamily F protein 3
MALLTLEDSNLLILDEPTNHLDVESIEALEDAIEEYEGSVLVVSHDRAVLRGLATQVWELRDEKLIQFPGSFVEWEQAKADRKAREEREAREVNARESERASKARAAANASANAASRAGRDATRSASAKGAASNSDTRLDVKKEARRLQKLLADAELRVSSLESRVQQLESALEDTTLYESTQGIDKAQRLGRELDEARENLEEAMHDWSAAAERFDALGVKV